MPPKGWRKTAEGFKPTNSSGASLTDRKVFGLNDLLLPRTLVVKMAKSALPEGTQLPKDGVTALMRSATVFIGYVTAEANNIARLEGRKTVSPGDILKALESLQFGTFVTPVVALSAKIREQAGKPREKVVSVTSETADGVEEDAEEHIDEDIEPETIAPLEAMSNKKQRQILFRQMVILPQGSEEPESVDGASHDPVDGDEATEGEPSLAESSMMVDDSTVNRVANESNMSTE